MYDSVLDDVLKEAHIPFVNKPHIPLYSIQTGKQVSFIIPDKLISNKIIVELKAKPFTTRDDIGQMVEYLKITHYEILFLVNFGEENFKPRRFIFTNDRKPFLAQSNYL